MRFVVNTHFSGINVGDSVGTLSSYDFAKEVKHRFGFCLLKQLFSMRTRVSMWYNVMLLALFNVRKNFH